MTELKGFGDGYASENELDTRALVQEQNRKKKKSGGFQSMGLSYNVYRGILKNGYKIPTPIQRKVSTHLQAFRININWILILVYPYHHGKQRCCCYGSHRKWKNRLFLNSSI